jgi:hypothetical protein
MLEHEWQELETLCERISDLRHRQSHAMRSRNVGLMEGLKEDINRTRRQREQLVRHISARLGSVAAERATPAHRASKSAQSDDAPLEHAALAAADIYPDESYTNIVGFSE